MKQGKSLMDLASEIERQQAEKHDYLASTSLISMLPNGADLGVNGKGTFHITEGCHDQIGQRLGIPAKYYDRLRLEHPDLLAYNANVLFQRKPEQRLVRTLDGNARAFLSNSYRALDHYNLLANVLPLIADSAQRLEVQSAEVTERRLYIKVSSPKVVGEVRKGDYIHGGFVISNSETGHGALSVFPYIVRLACLNGATVDEYGKRKYHVGRNLRPDEGDAYEIFQDDTIKADDEALWKKVRDIIMACIEQSRFDKIISKLKEQDQQNVPDPEAAVEEISNRFGMVESERKGILTQLIQGGLGTTRYAIVQAVSAHAAEVESYDRATQLEEVSGNLITLPESEWRQVAA